MHFAFIAPPFLSHARALEALAAALLERGHRVAWLNQVDARRFISHPGIEFHAVGTEQRPAGSLDALLARAARPGGWHGLRRVIEDVASGTDMFCTEAPRLLERLGADAIVADQMEAAGGLLADGLRIPFVSVACALPVNRDLRVPLPVMPWGYASDERAEQLNEGSRRVYDWLMQPHGRIIAAHAQRFGLGRRTALHQCLSGLAQISQTIPSFDFPRTSLEPHFHHVGPLRTAQPEPASFDWRVDPDRPFVFASLGTMQGARLRLFQRIAKACRMEGAQVLIAHCNGLSGAHEEALRQEGALVTAFAPQRLALARAQVVVTHAGLNTVMDAFACGTPQLALPIAFDQPGVAARIAHVGSGLRVWPPLASVRALRHGLRRLLDEPDFARRSAALGRECALSGGVRRAAAITEAAVSRRSAVTHREVDSWDAAPEGASRG